MRRVEYGESASVGNGIKLPPAAMLLPCPRCGEMIHADSMICCVCGQILHLLKSKADTQDAQSRPCSRKALASLILGCFSFLLLPGLAAVILGHIAQREFRKGRMGLRGRRFANAGLALGYLGLLGTPLLLSIFGFPGELLRRRISSEDSAVNSLNILNVALHAYDASYGKGFPEKLSQLGPSKEGVSPGPIASGFVDGSLASGSLEGYKFTYIITARDAEGAPVAYTINADPESAARGSRHFFTDQTQVIRSAQSRAADQNSTPLEREP